MGKKLARLVLVAVIGLAVFLLWLAGERTEELAEQTAPVSVPSRSGSTAARVSSAPLRLSSPVPSSPATGTVETVDAPLPGPDAIPGEQVLMFYDDSHLRAFIRLAMEEGLEVVDRIGRLHAVRVRVRDNSVLRRVLLRSPAPTVSGPNLYVRQPDPPPPVEADDAKAFGRSAAAWLGGAPDRSDWGAGVTVAVLDTAVVPEAVAAEVEMVDLVSEAAGAIPVGHGTAVASIIAGGGDVAGMAPGASLLAVRVMDDRGVGDTFTLAGGVMDALARGARVINMSVGSRGDSPVLARAIAMAQAEGAVVVAAAGNSSADSVLYPAAYPGVLAVGAVDADGRHVNFSNRGAELDLVAPGVGVAATGVDGETVAFSGTSAATPFVSGALAAVWSVSPELSNSDVADLLVRYADDAGAPGHDNFYGAGVLNVGRVLERDTPGIIDMVLVRPHVEVSSTRGDEMVLTLFGQNRGTEPLERVQLVANVDGAPVDLTVYDVGVGDLVQHDVSLTRAGIGERTIAIEQEVTTADGEDRSPHNNRMLSTLSVQPPTSDL